MNVYVRKNTSYHFPIIYVLKIIEKNRNVIFNIKDSSAEAEIIWDHKNIKSEVLACDFFDSIKNGSASLKHSEVFLTSPNVTDKNGNVDKIASIFYMINSLQEFNVEQKDLDDLGRFKYSSSYLFRPFSLCKKASFCFGYFFIISSGNRPENIAFREKDVAEGSNDR